MVLVLINVFIRGLLFFIFCAIYWNRITHFNNYKQIYMYILSYHQSQILIYVKKVQQLYLSALKKKNTLDVKKNFIRKQGLNKYAQSVSHKICYRLNHINNCELMVYFTNCIWMLHRDFRKHHRWTAGPCLVKAVIVRNIL